MSENQFTLIELTAYVTGGNLPAMAKLLNDAGANPRLDEVHPDPACRSAPSCWSTSMPYELPIE